MSDESVLLAVDGGLARITLNRPDRLNALTRVMMVRLGEVVADLTKREDVRVISITGAGRGFCAGQDLSERDPGKLPEPLDLAAIQRELFHPVIRGLAEASKPVVTCVNGVAAGAGAGLALAGDIVVAAESAKFAFSFAKVGLSVDAGLGWALAAGLGAQRARALLMLGETLPAPDAATAGLIWQVWSDDALAERHEALLRQLAATPRTALSGIKTAIAAANLSLEAYLDVEAAAQGRAGLHPDYAEGVLSFLERRPPVFS